MSTISATAAEPSCSSVVPAGRFTITRAMTMRYAGLRSITISAEFHGPDDAPVIIVGGGISAGRHAVSSPAFPTPGWWQEQIGVGRPLDPTRHRIVALDWLAANGELDLPIDTADQADAAALALDELGVAGATAYVGSSYGAMVGLQFAARHRHRLDRLVVISGGHRPHPYACALRAVQRGILGLGGDDHATAALGLARQLAMLTYRTPAEFAQRFAGPVQLGRHGVRAASADYLEHCGDRYAARTSPVAFRRLSESIDLHHLDPATVTRPTTVVSVAEDQLVPPALLEELAERLGGPHQLVRISSLTGHDAFLTEPQLIGDALRVALPGGAA